MPTRRRTQLELEIDKLRKQVDKRQTVTEAEIRATYERILELARGYASTGEALLKEAGLLDYPVLGGEFHPGDGARYDAQRLKVLKGMLKEMETAVAGPAGSVSASLHTLATDAYSMTYKGMVDVMGKDIGNAVITKVLNHSFLRPEVLKRALWGTIHPLAKVTKRLQPDIQDRIRKALVNGFMSGGRHEQVALDVQKALNVSYRRATCIARTETHRIREDAMANVADRVNGLVKKVNRVADGLPEVPEPPVPTPPNPAGPVTNTEIANIVREEQQRGTPKRVPRIVFYKTWRTAQDGKVRHNGEANHRRLHGQTVEVDEEFDLGGGITAKCPGSSGTPYNDINCRCRVSYGKVMDDGTGAWRERLDAKFADQRRKIAKEVEATDAWLDDQEELNPDYKSKQERDQEAIDARRKAALRRKANRAAVDAFEAKRRKAAKKPEN